MGLIVGLGGEGGGLCVWSGGWWTCWLGGSLICAVAYICLHFAAVDLDVTGTGAVVAFLRPYPLAEREMARSCLVCGKVFESVRVGGDAEEGRVLTRCASGSGTVPFAAGEKITVCVVEVAQHIDELC